ncbi:hypothetical protein TH63_19390 [Rufibacter radiotolerans]|uniref:Uncharacterized protein n=1 Tax=Rufibacter radiotolerans TaxID=1379910 RepID=A0A0H4VPT5_9BACT|nr:hypothetical protein [Rufibacter radiotolerans]AKQ47318.1 hypothetical protein TH63_19390 [Rufibacter radiotolerans]
MKFPFPLLSFFAFLFLFTSCQEDLDDLEVKARPANLESLSDSCSYRLNGKLYTLNKRIGEGFQNAEVKLDSITHKGHPDSVLYSTLFSLGSPRREYLDIRFIKKYGKNQMTKPDMFLMHPGNKSDLYAKGQHPYAVDYTRFNTQNGIAIEVWNPGYPYLTSHLPWSKNWLTTIGYDCQSNSSFEITRLQRLRNGNFLMEAKFSVNLYSYDASGNTPPGEKPIEVATLHRIENGFIRLQVDL